MRRYSTLPAHYLSGLCLALLLGGCVPPGAGPGGGVLDLFANRGAAVPAGGHMVYALNRDTGGGTFRPLVCSGAQAAAGEDVRLAAIREGFHRLCEATVSGTLGEVEAADLSARYHPALLAIATQRPPLPLSPPAPAAAPPSATP